MRVYIAGPMAGRLNYNYPAFHAAAERLRGEGYEVINPAELNGMDEGREVCMRRDIGELITCDAIYLLEDWQFSRGANLEREIAEQCGMEVLYEITQ